MGSMSLQEGCLATKSSTTSGSIDLIQNKLTCVTPISDGPVSACPRWELTHHGSRNMVATLNPIRTHIIMKTGSYNLTLHYRSQQRGRHLHAHSCQRRSEVGTRRTEVEEIRK
ncbi:hypothetical protein EYF80_016431 [Liparis tanakae]|uniref:Uncharacterized protein n=1 Tax=Liparis tanakae TaxID=230148 RepID=A0A4Z2I5M9_9TELE|nr:hypothetical protein EYF80_016431 [Liparis tanakae]